jgi:hypothetical protein
MAYFPKFSVLTQVNELEQFAKKCKQLHGQEVSLDYLNNAHNRVVGVFINSELSGGFVLGAGIDFLTIRQFAQKENQDKICRNMKGRMFTEVACFWMDPVLQKCQLAKWLTWAFLALSIVRFGHRFVVFGTCSTQLAQVFKASSRVCLLHNERVGKHQTFIFYTEQKHGLAGMLEIAVYKFQQYLSQEWNRVRSIPRTAVGDNDPHMSKPVASSQPVI